MGTHTSRTIALALVATTLAVLCGCQLPPSGFKKYGVVPVEENETMQKVELTNRITAELLAPPTNRFTLGPGDRLDIEVIGETNSLVSTLVAPDGKVYYSILPGIDVWGLTLPQAKAQIEKGLSTLVRNHPQVALRLRAVESKHFWVLGRVTAPGVFPLVAPTTLLEAIALAGGTMNLSAFANQDVASITEELADLPRSFVIRDGKMLPVNFQRLIQQGDMSQNIYLQPDDFIYFPGKTVREVYVLGAVGQPRPVAFKQGMTVVQAVASAYGTLTGAYLHHVLVIRGSLQEPMVAIVDYKNVIRGEAKDIALMPQDIVYVPYSPYRYLERYIELVINTFVSSSAINVGAKAIGTPPSGVGGVFIPVGSGIQIVPPVAPPPIQ